MGFSLDEYRKQKRKETIQTNDAPNGLNNDRFSLDEYIKQKYGAQSAETNQRKETNWLGDAFNGIRSAYYTLAGENQKRATEAEKQRIDSLRKYNLSAAAVELAREREKKAELEKRHSDVYNERMSFGSAISDGDKFRKLGKEYDDIGKQIENAEQNIKRIESEISAASRQRRTDKYNEARFAEDFEEYSAKGKEQTDLSGKFENDAYLTVDGGVDKAAAGRIDRYNAATDWEKKLYNYYVGKGNAEELKEYTDFMKPELNARVAAKQNAQFEKEAEENPVGASVASVFTNLAKIEGTVYSIVSAIAGQEIDPNSEYFVANRATNTMRGTVSENIKKNVGGTWGDVLSFGYDTLMSMADTASRLALGKGGLVLAGTTAMSDSVMDAKQRGATNAQAITVGLFSGAAEVVFEKASLESLIKISSPSARNYAIKNILKQSFTEASEETLTEISNVIADSLVMGDLSNYNTAINEYMMQGMSEAEARKQAAIDTAKQIGEASLGGALSGGAFGAGGSAVSGIRTRGIGADIIRSGGADSTVKRGLSLGEGTRAYELAQKNSGKKVKKSDIGRQYIANIEAVNAETTALEKSMKADGANADEIKTATNAVYKVARGGAITTQEAAALLKHDSAWSAVTKLTGIKSKPEGNSAKVLADSINSTNGIQTSKQNSAKITQTAENNAEKIKLEYAKAVDPEIKAAADEYRKNPNAPFKRIKISDVSEREAVAIKAIAGIDVRGYTHDIDRNAFIHIQNRHGVNGKSDNSMADTNDIARIAYVIKNYDAIEPLKDSDDNLLTAKGYMDSQNNSAKMIKYTKRINGNYYIVEAISDNKYKKLWTISAYKNKAEVTQASHAQSAQQFTSDNVLASPSNNNIPQKSGKNKSEGRVINEHKGKASKELKVQERILSAYAKEAGVNIRIVDAIYDQNGKASETQEGYYDEDKNEIVLSLKTGENKLTYVAGHELIHRIRAYSEEAYKALERLVLEHLKGIEGYDLEARINDIIRTYKAEGISIDRKGAIEEIVAKSYAQALSDGTAIAKLAARDRALLEKIRDILNEICDRFERIARNIAANDAEARTFLGEVDTLKEMRDTFFEILDGMNGENESRSGKKHWLNPSFEKEYDAWDKKNPTVKFRIGNTSKALQSIGVKEQNIIWDASKIIKIKSKHKAMTDDVIKQVPGIIENPTLIIQSKQKDSRIVVFGEVFDVNDNPVLAVLELEPIGVNNLVLDLIKVASAYGKDSNPQRLIDTSEILYIEPNKNRTDKWLTSTRLQLPVGVNQYGSINKISYSDIAVNSSIRKDERKDTVKFSVFSEEETKYLDKYFDDAIEEEKTMYMATAEAILEELSDGDSGAFGVRSDYNKYEPGDDMKKSMDLTDDLEPNPDDPKGIWWLDGTSAVSIDDYKWDTSDSDAENKVIIAKSIKDAADFLEKNYKPSVSNYIYLVGGRNYDSGNDPREVLLYDGYGNGGKVLYVIKKSGELGIKKAKAENDADMRAAYNEHFKIDWVSDFYYIWKEEREELREKIKHLEQYPKTSKGNYLLTAGEGTNIVVSLLKANKGGPYIDEIHRLRFGDKTETDAVLERIYEQYRTDENGANKTFWKKFNGKHVYRNTHKRKYSYEQYAYEQMQEYSSYEEYAEAQKEKNQDEKNNSIKFSIGGKSAEKQPGTGWFKGKDGKMRFEIDDSEAKVNYAALETQRRLRERYEKTGVLGRGFTMTLSEVLEHEELYAAYPEIKDTFVWTMDLGKEKSAYRPDLKLFVINANAPKSRIKSDLLHEIQHYIQQKEDFAKGGSRELAEIYILNRVATQRDKKAFEGKTREERMNILKKRAEKWAERYGVEYDTLIDSIYYGLFGEQEAREVQKRADMSKAERELIPIEIDGLVVQSWEAEQQQFDELVGEEIEKSQTYYQLAGYNAYGDEVYRTTEAIKALSMEERIAEFERIFNEEYIGKKVKFTINGKEKTAELDRFTKKKNIDNSYGKGQKEKALAKLGADGDFITLLENARYDKNVKERNEAKNDAHKGVKTRDYFVKTIVVDEKLFDVVIGIRNKKDGSFVYEVTLKQNKKRPRNAHVYDVITPPPSAVEQKAPSGRKDTIAQSRGEVKYSVANDDISSLVDEYGAIKKGENPARDIDVPKKTSKYKKVRQFTRTILESGAVTDEMVEPIKEKILEEAFSYRPISDAKARESAERTIATLGMERASRKWIAAIEEKKAPTKEQIALGEYLLKAAAEAGNAKDVVQFAAELAEAGTRAGQAVQAMRMLKKLDGMAQLVYIQRAASKLALDAQQKMGRAYKKKFNGITINEDLALELATAKTEGEIEVARARLMQDIAEQLPVTFRDKWNAWRYLAMLANLKTHERNILGNMVFYPAVKIKNAVGTGIEKAYLRGERKGERTKSAKVKTEYKAFAAEDFENIKNVITGGGKYNPTDEIMDMRRIFKSGTLEKLRLWNSKFLENEDIFFLRRHYRDALGGFLQARNIDINNITAAELEEARSYAILEAQKATYRDASRMANVISDISKKYGMAGVFIEGLLPFKKTPINILKRGVEYSPAGLINALAKGVRGKGTQEIIDSLAAGLTGTGIFMLGMLLKSLGFIEIGLGDDKEDEFKKLQGEQSYSIRIAGQSYTIDWLAPVSMPFFAGAELQRLFEEDDELSFADVYDSVSRIAAPMIEMSMLSGISDVIDSMKYADDAGGKLVSAAETMATNYLTQGVPTVLGQAARTIDDTQRRTFIDKNSGVPGSVQYLVQSVQKKIPVLSQSLEPRINLWGEEDTQKNVGWRMLDNFVNPSYAEKIEINSVEKEINRLFDETGETKILPSYQNKFYTINGEKKYLSAKDYTAVSKLRGQMSYEILNDMFNSNEYKNLDEETKLKAIAKTYDFAYQTSMVVVTDDYEYRSEWMEKAAKSATPHKNIIRQAKEK